MVNVLTPKMKYSLNRNMNMLLVFLDSSITNLNHRNINALEEVRHCVRFCIPCGEQQDVLPALGELT